MRTPLPRKGSSADLVIEELRARKAGDADWRGGKVPLFVFKADDAVAEIGRRAFFEYFDENALGGARAFPGVRQMEQEVIGMALGLFEAPEAAVGYMTTGGTESIVQALQSCRGQLRARRGDPFARGNIVMPESAHPAFDKGARLMDITVRRVPVGADFRADVAAMENAIDDDTMMIVGSAPCFPYGVIDPIDALSELALRRRLWLHVDACVGGYLAPFVKLNGRPIPDFDFRLPGVASMSADLHKFGFCPKPASTVLYRDTGLAAHHAFEFDAWPSGRFYTTTVVGTRPAGGVAAAWAVMRMLGVDGYCRIATDLMAMVDRYRAGITAIDGLSVVADPHLSIVAFTASDIDPFAIAETLADKGWVPGLIRKPRGVHRMMSLLHEPSLDSYLADVRATADALRQRGPAGTATLEARY